MICRCCLVNELPEKLAKKIRTNPETGCWEWNTGGRPGDIGHGGGYARVWWQGTRGYAHRTVYTILKGPIPEGRQLDHLCRVRHCVNPEHLEPVTQRENLLRGDGWAGRLARQTHCKRGHLLEGDNLRKMSDPTRGRECRLCFNYLRRKERS